MEPTGHEQALRRVELVIEPIADVQLDAAAEGQQPAELDAAGIRQVQDPVRHQVVTFVVAHLLRVVHRVRETEVVVEPLGLTLAVRVREARPPAPVAFCSGAVRPVDLHLQGVVPGLAGVSRQQNRAEAGDRMVHEASTDRERALGAGEVLVRPVEREDVEAARARVSRVHHDVPYHPPHAHRELAGLGRPEVVGNELDFGSARLGVRDAQRVQGPWVGRIDRVPVDPPGGRVSRRAEVDDDVGVLLRELLLDRVVEQRPIVEDAEAAIHGRCPRPVQGIGQPEARLERAHEARSLCPVREIALRIDREEHLTRILRQRIHDRLGRDVAVVQHVAFVVPPDAKVQRQGLDGTPIVLQVRTDLQIVGDEVRITGVELDPIWDLEAVGPDRGVRRELRVDEPRDHAVLLDHPVIQNVQAHSALDDVLAVPADGGVGEVVAQPEAVLLEVLDRDVRTDLRSIEGVGEIAIDGFRSGHGTRIVPGVLEAHRRLVQPRARYVTVPESGGRHVILEMHAGLEGSVAAEVPRVRFVPRVEAQLE